MYRLFTLSIFLSFFTLSFSQQTSEQFNKEVILESKRGVKNTTLSDSVLLFHYSRVISYYAKQELNPDSIIYYSNSALSKFKNKKDDFPYKVNTLLNNLSVAYWYKSNYEKAISIVEEKMKMFPDRDDDEKVSDLMNLGLFNIELGSYLNGMDHLFEAERLVLNLLNNCHECSSKKSLFEKLSTVYINLGLAFENIGDSKKAIDFYEKSIEYLFKSGLENPDDLATLYVNIGVQFNTMKKYKQAKIYFDLASNTLGESKFENTKGIVKYNLGTWYQNADSIEKAETLYLEAIEHYKTLGSKNEVGRISRGLGQLYLESNELKAAKNYLDLANEKFEHSKSKKDKAKLYRSYANYYEVMSDAEKAFKYLQKYLNISEEIVSTQIKQEGLRKEYNKELEKQQYIDSLESAKRSTINKEELRRKDLELRAKRNQQILLGAGLFISAILLFIVFKRHRQNLKQKSVIESQHKTLSEKNKEVLDSITYAKRLQDAILPSEKNVKSFLKDSFILYKPKDIVAGDFYFMDVVEEKDKKLIYYVAADCTGHGVPGAMVSIIGANGLKRCIQEFGLRKPGEILDRLAKIVVENFAQSEERIRDGMDIALCCLEVESDHIKRVHFAGANNPLWVINPNRKEVPERAKPFKEGGGFEIKANKQAIGYTENISPFVTHTIELEKGDTLYTFSDGYPDQFGGEKGKKLKSTNFRKILFEIQDKSMDEQLAILDQRFEEWKGGIEQLDDVCVIGVRL